eukprot:scaffold31802_cov78-Skeletonema_dohrnii-CCMP3373.AAC.3
MIGRAIIVALLTYGLYQSTNSNIGSLTCTQFQYFCLSAGSSRSGTRTSQDDEPIAASNRLPSQDFG